MKLTAVYRGDLGSKYGNPGRFIREMLIGQTEVHRLQRTACYWIIFPGTLEQGCNCGGWTNPRLGPTDVDDRLDVTVFIRLRVKYSSFPNQILTFNIKLSIFC